LIAINITSCGQSKRADSAARRRGCLAVEIEDRGRGMPPGLTAQLQSGGGGLGVGGAGMRERLQQLGGWC
jgi:signal transduction histidine kinase